jgi:hypothetical protein
MKFDLPMATRPLRIVVDVCVIVLVMIVLKRTYTGLARTDVIVVVSKDYLDDRRMIALDSPLRSTSPSTEHSTNQARVSPSLELLPLLPP